LTSGGIIGSSVLFSLLLITIFSHQNAYAFHEAVPFPAGNEGGRVCDLGLFDCPGKWAVYGCCFNSMLHPSPIVETEVKGTVVQLEDGLYVVPDRNYYNIIAPGSILRPSVANDCNGGEKQTIARELDSLTDKNTGFVNVDVLISTGKISGQCGGGADYDYNFVPHLTNLGLPLDSPIIKMETANLGTFGDYWIALTDCEKFINNKGEQGYNCGPPSYSPYDPIKSGGPVQIGDHVKVKGLWAIELQHTMWYVGCHPPFLEGADCYGHTELHPFELHKVESALSPDQLKPGDVNTERHTLAAPFYTKVHTCANFVVKVFDPNCSRLPDEAGQTTVTNTFFIKAPPKPAECSINHCNLRYKEAKVAEDTAIAGSITSRNEVGADNINTPGTPCYSINQDLKGLENEMNGLQQELETASTGEKPAIIRQIRELNAQIETKENQLRQCILENPNGVNVIVTATGQDIARPTIYQADMSTWWEADNTAPPVSPLSVSPDDIGSASSPSLSSSQQLAINAQVIDNVSVKTSQERGDNSG
jgi:hypothetical protein